VGPDVGSDHHPVYAKLAFIGKPKEQPKQPELGIVPVDAYYHNDFGLNAVSAGKLSLPLAEWPMETYPKVRFTYKIPVQLPIIVRVLTPFNDWICLAGTAAAVCPHAKSNEYIVLVDDDAWHEVEINADSSVKSILKAVNGIKEWQFVVPEGQASAGEFRIGNFIISK
jgi:hypothetical protein